MTKTSRSKKPVFDTLTCQICGGEYAAREGLIANHGFQRNAGWNSTGCPGSRELPLEVGRDVIRSMIGSWDDRIKKLSAKPIVAKVDEATPVHHIVAYAQDLRLELNVALQQRKFWKDRYDAWVQTISDDDWQAHRDKSLANRSRATTKGWTHRARSARSKSAAQAETQQRAFIVEQGVQVAMFFFNPTGRIFESIPNGDGSWDVIDSHDDLTTVPADIARQLGSAAA